jgi:hypothetical protein
LQHDNIHLRREAELLQIDLDSIQKEGGQLQDISRLQQMENVELAKQLKNAKMALVLEEGIQKNLAIAAEGAKLIMATDKAELIRRDLEHLVQGGAPGLQDLVLVYAKFHQ